MAVFIIQNQLDLYLDKHQNWISSENKGLIYRTQYHDEALNLLIEINAKDINIRGKILEVELDEKQQPNI